MTCYAQIKVLNVNILLLTSISSSAFNTVKFMQQFLQHLSNGTIQFFPAYDVHILFQGHVHAIQMVKCQIRV